MAPSNNDDGLNTGSDTVNDSYAGTIQEEIVHPLLAGDESSADTTHSAAIVGRPILRRLYASHFLSTFNSRVFEFGAVLFLAAVYPASLAPLSTYALVRNAAAIVLSRVVGAWIDAGDRLAVVRTSIVAGRAAVVASCAALLGLLSLVRGNEASPTGWGSTLLFVVLVGLACVEKLTSIMNLMAVERDWVVAMTEDDDLLRQSTWSSYRDLRADTDMRWEQMSTPRCVG